MTVLIGADLKDKINSSHYKETKRYLWFNRQCNRVARGTKASVGISASNFAGKIYQVVIQELLTVMM